MNMSDLIPDAKKGIAVYRIMVGFCSIIMTILVTAIFGYAKSADAKLTTTSSNVDKIMWELPVIKETAKSDKAETLRQIENMEQRIQSIRTLRDGDSSELHKLKTDVALLKQKAQIP